MDRRHLLKTLSLFTAIGLSGCTKTEKNANSSSSTNSSETNPKPRMDSWTKGDDWKHHQHDPANTGYNPDTEGLKQNNSEEEKELEILWKKNFDTTPTSLAAYDGKIYTATKNLHCFDAKTGEKLCDTRLRFEKPPSVKLSDDPYTSISISDNTLYIASSNGSLSAVDPDDGRKLWDEKIEYISGITAKDNNIYVGSNNFYKFHSIGSIKGEKIR